MGITWIDPPNILRLSRETTSALPASPVQCCRIRDDSYREIGFLCIPQQNIDLEHLVDLLLGRDPILRQHGNKRLTRAVLFYMYWNC